MAVDLTKTRDVMNLLQTDSAFDKSILTEIDNTNSYLETTLVELESLPGGEEHAAVIRNVQGNLPQFRNHTETQFNNLPNNLSLMASRSNIEATMDQTDPDDLTSLCQNVLDAFGSIMGAGGELINQLFTYTQSLAEMVAGGLSSAITSIVNLIAGVLGELANMIFGENNILSETLGILLGYGNAVKLQSLFNDPCAKLVLGAVASGALVALL